MSPRPPSKLLWAAEIPRAAWTVATWWRHLPALREAPAGDGRPVLLLPGLFNSDRSMTVMRSYLHRLGYDAEGWGMGRNLGARTVGGDADRLIDLVATIAARSGPVTLVGVSLGGMLARLIAHRRPDLVRSIVTVSSPYAGSGRSTNVWLMFQWLTGEQLDDPALVARSTLIAKPLPVPATAIWSRSDGLVAGEICRDATAACIEISSPHLGVQIKPATLIAVARAIHDAP